MSPSILLWLLLAVAVFWAVGAYNRLMRLRARARDALGSLDKALVQQADLVCRRFGVSAEPDVRSALQAVHDVPLHWAALLDAVGQVDGLLRRLRTQPLDGAGLHSLGLALDTLQLHWRALSTAPADLAGAALPEDMRLDWEVLAEKSRSARSGLNQILAHYDEAIAQFPARLLARFLGYTPVGQL